MIVMTFVETLLFFITGLGLGLIISAPVGPVNILCIQHSLSGGFWAGFATGCGAVLADFFIAAMAALGLTYISGIVLEQKMLIEGIGGLILIGFGWRLATSHPRLLPGDDRSLSPYRHFGALPQSFLLTLTNPGALLGIFAVVGSAGSLVGGLQSFTTAFYLLAGLLVGAVCWWAGLSWLISRLRSKMTARRLEMINHVAGGILLLSGFGLLIKAGVQLL